jgi:hypothetical protein
MAWVDGSYANAPFSIIKSAAFHDVPPRYDHVV